MHLKQKNQSRLILLETKWRWDLSHRRKPVKPGVEGTYPPGTKVVIPGDGETPIEVIIERRSVQE